MSLTILELQGLSELLEALEQLQDICSGPLETQAQIDPILSLIGTALDRAYGLDPMGSG